MNDPAGSPGAPPGDKVVGRDAIIYIPGLTANTGDQSVDSVCRRIAASLDRNAASSLASFVLNEGRDEDYKVDHKTRIITISRRDGAIETPVVDVFELNYQRALSGAFRKRLPIAQAASVAGMVLLHWRAFYRSVRAKRNSVADQAQLAYAGLLLILLSAYIVMVIATAVGTAVSLTRDRTADSDRAAEVASETSPPGIESADQPGDPPPVEGSDVEEGRSLLGAFQVLIVFLTFVGFLVPIDLKGIVERVANEVTPAMAYLSAGSRRGVVLGQLADLLEHLVEKEEDPAVRYDRIHLVGYSFGSIVAIDALFQNVVPSERFGRIRTLISIGCPFEFVCSYWPNYFQDRHPRPQVPRWDNYFVPADVLGSDFSAKPNRPGPRGIGLAAGGERLPDANIRHGASIDTRAYSPLEWATLIGFRLHGSYWERGEPSDAGVFEPIVRALFAERGALI